MRVRRFVKAQQEGRRREHGAGVAGGNKRIGLARLLKAEPDDYAGIRLPADRGERLLTHPDDVRCRHHVDAGAVDATVRGQLRLDGFGAANQLHGKIGMFGERLERARDFGPGCVVTPHRVNGDANHFQLSSTSTTFLPP